MIYRESKGISEKQKAREFQKKTFISVSSTMLKSLTVWITSLTVWITTNCGKLLERWEYQTILPASREICMQVKKQQLEPGMEQQTGSKLGKEYVKAAYCHPANLIICRVHHAKCWAR